MKTIYTILFALIIFQAHAQQMPQFSQYATNNFLLNPAISGSYNHGEIKVGGRTQWTGFPGAPQTIFVSGHTPVRKANIRARKKSGQYHGIGGMVYLDKIGPFTNTAVYGAYAVHIPLGKKTVASLGTSIGLRQLTLHREQLVFVQYATDPAIEQQPYSRFLPDGNAGFWLNNNNYFAGLGVSQLFRNKLPVNKPELGDYNLSTLQIHYYGTVGYIHRIDKFKTLVTSVMIKAVASAPLSADLNVIYHDKDYWIGGGYRHMDSFIILAGINIQNYSIGYSYDITISKVRKVSWGSHEVVLGIKLPRSKIDCPSNYW